MDNEKRECYMMAKDQASEVSWEAMFALLQKIQGVLGKVTKEQLTEWWDGQPIDYEKFLYILEQARVTCEQGSVDLQLQKLRRSFIHDIFVILDTNKDQKVSKAEVVTLMQEVPSPKPITEAEVTEWMDAGEYKSLMNKSAFSELLEDYVLEDRKDIPLPILYLAAKAQQETRVATKAKTVKLLDRVRAFSVKNKDVARTSSSSSPRTPALSAGGTSFNRPNVSFSSAERSASISMEDPPTSSPADTGGGGGGATESPHSPAKKRLWPSLRRQSQAPVTESAFENQSPNTSTKELNRLTLDLKHKDEDMRRLHAQLERREQELHAMHERTSRSPTSPASVGTVGDDLLRKLDSQAAHQERLIDGMDRLRDENLLLEQQNAKFARDNERLSAQVKALLHEAQEDGDRLEALDRALQAEKEKNRDLLSLRKKETTEATKRKADLSKLKTDLKAKTEELEQAQDLIEKCEMELALAKLNEASNAEGGSPRTRRVSSVGSDDSDAEDAPVVYLNPPQQKHYATEMHRTLFSEPSPVYYEFPAETRPSQLLFEVMVRRAHTTEYVACRDSGRRRSLSFSLERGALQVPLCDPFPLEPETWHSVAVAFNWARQRYGLHVGGEKVTADQAFRDASVTGVGSFDAYPRTDAAIVYANIRFVDC